MPPPQDRPDRIVVIQTAFPGDLILTLPLLQVLKRYFPTSEIDVVVTPHAAPILENHPAVAKAIVYDKRLRDAGTIGFARIVSKLRARRYSVALIPHRSIRSAALAFLAGVRRRIGFSTSTGKFLLTDVVKYRSDIHEIDRNLSLAGVLVSPAPEQELPLLYPSEEDRKVVDLFLRLWQRTSEFEVVGIAPGTVWNTKRWPPEKFRALIAAMADRGNRVVLIGGNADVPLCQDLLRGMSSDAVRNVAGEMSLLQSAEVIRRCKVLIANDSAPMHLAVAMRTPVVAIFGATVPAFGFAPLGENDRVVEISGLQCRPCSIHGGKRCPIKTFDCMERIAPEMVIKEIEAVLHGIV